MALGPLESRLYPWPSAWSSGLVKPPAVSRALCGRLNSQRVGKIGAQAFNGSFGNFLRHSPANKKILEEIVATGLQDEVNVQFGRFAGDLNLNRPPSGVCCSSSDLSSFFTCG